MRTCTIYNSENAKVNEGIAGASLSSSRAELKGVSSTATIWPLMMHLLIIIINCGPWTYYMHVKSTVASGNTAMCSWLDISIMSIPLFRHSAVSPGPVRGGGGGGTRNTFFQARLRVLSTYSGC